MSNHRKDVGWLLWWQTLWMAARPQKKESLTVHGARKFFPRKHSHGLRPDARVAGGRRGCSGSRNSKSEPTGRRRGSFTELKGAQRGPSHGAWTQPRSRRRGPGGPGTESTCVCCSGFALSPQPRGGRSQALGAHGNPLKSELQPVWQVGKSSAQCLFAIGGEWPGWESDAPEVEVFGR